jgi:N-acyl-L-homoserine lactone synthetase
MLQLHSGGQLLTIDFGAPTLPDEYFQMFRLRHDRYLEKGYIAARDDGLDYDIYDQRKQCHYVIASIDRRVVGTVRLIVGNTLPTEDYFSFHEPDQMRELPRSCRGEVSRLVVEREAKLAQHLITIGLVYTLYLIAEEGQILGGYLYVKNYLRRILASLGIPLHDVGSYTLKHAPDYMAGYFAETQEPTAPLYFLTKEVGQAAILLINQEANGRSWRKVS